MSAAFNREI